MVHLEPSPNDGDDFHVYADILLQLQATSRERLTAMNDSPSRTPTIEIPSPNSITKDNVFTDFISNAESHSIITSSNAGRTEILLNIGRQRITDHTTSAVEYDELETNQDVMLSTGNDTHSDDNSSEESLQIFVTDQSKSFQSEINDDWGSDDGGSESNNSSFHETVMKKPDTNIQERSLEFIEEVDEKHDVVSPMVGALDLKSINVESAESLIALSHNLVLYSSTNGASDMALNNVENSDLLIALPQDLASYSLANEALDMASNNVQNSESLIALPQDLTSYSTIIGALDLASNNVENTESVITLSQDHTPLTINHDRTPSNVTKENNMDLVAPEQRPEQSAEDVQSSTTAYLLSQVNPMKIGVVEIEISIIAAYSHQYGE